MASAKEWLEGARIRTLPASVAPVLVGSAAAWLGTGIGAATGVAGGAGLGGGFHLGRMLLAMIVALGLQVGVNFANDYSDGVRGTDDVRVGPQRLVGSGAAQPKTVKMAAFASFGVAGVAGLVLVAMVAQWWLLAVGAACVAAAWFYTGGKHPYGYLGLGELFVFIFFGLVATLGTTFTQLGRLTWASFAGSVAIGAVACAVLVCNNLRDLPQDKRVGKRTLATRLGDRGTRVFYVALAAVCVLGLGVMAALTAWWLLAGALGAVIFLAPAVRAVLGGAVGMALVRVLKFTGFGELGAGVGIFIAALVS